MRRSLMKLESLQKMKHFNYNHINLVPKKCIVNSRKECDTSITLSKGSKQFCFMNPVIPANMECIINEEMAEKLAFHNYFYVMHRFDVDVISFLAKMKAKGLYTSISMGVNEDSYELLQKMMDTDNIPDFITIDIAHGHCIKMEKILGFLQSHSCFDETFLIAGNVGATEGVEDLEKWGADIIKVGIGPGCFRGDTRVLMANGIYKDIKDIEVGEYVINKEGKPVEVLSVANKGFKKVVMIKNNLHYKETYVTDDHQFFIGDLSGLSESSLTSGGIAKCLDKQAKTVPKSSKYKWKKIRECNWDNTFALFPKEIDWMLEENFSIDLCDTILRAKFDDDFITTNGGKTPTTFHRHLKSNYELGYIFGTFLGDGCSRLDVDKNTNCESGDCSWTFGADQEHICQKLCDCIEKILGIRPTYNLEEDRNIFVLKLYNKCFTKVLHTFGKRIEKHLPSKYYCKNKEYITGLFDGLVDSDGHKEKTNSSLENTILCFTNTSIHLIELFEWCCFNLQISFTSSKHSDENRGNLTGLSENSKFNTSYRIKTHTMNRFTKSFLYSNITKESKSKELIETWDIEVDCPTHSFIANNMIVHNSACTTYHTTGFGTREIQASVVEDCAKVRRYPNTLLIADGGISEPADITKALVLGANLVMVGGMFSGLQDSPGPTVSAPDGKLYKEFWGSASAHQSGKTSRIEGTKKLFPLQNKSMLEMMHYLQECLQSSISYGGGNKLSDLKNVEYICKK